MTLLVANIFVVSPTVEWLGTHVTVCPTYKCWPTGLPTNYNSAQLAETCFTMIAQPVNALSF